MLKRIALYLLLVTNSITIVLLSKAYKDTSDTIDAMSYDIKFIIKKSYFTGCYEATLNKTCHEKADKFVSVVWPFRD